MTESNTEKLVRYTIIGIIFGLFTSPLWFILVVMKLPLKILNILFPNGIDNGWAVIFETVKYSIILFGLIGAILSSYPKKINK